MHDVNDFYFTTDTYKVYLVIPEEQIKKHLIVKKEDFMDFINSIVDDKKITQLVIIQKSFLNCDFKLLPDNMIWKGEIYG